MSTYTYDDAPGWTYTCPGVCIKPGQLTADIQLSFEDTFLSTPVQNYLGYGTLTYNPIFVPPVIQNPLPSAIWLFAAGLVVLLAVRRKWL